MDKKLTEVQRTILNLAAYRPDGDIEPLPPALRGGAKTKVLAALLKAGMITDTNKLTDAGYAAVERKRPVPAVVATVPEHKINPAKARATVKAILFGSDADNKEPAVVAPPQEPEANVGPETAAVAKVTKTRDGTKQAQVIEMLKRRPGASIAEVCAATGWQPHTVRGFFAGTIKKKLGLDLQSFKTSTERDTGVIVRTYSL